MNEEETLQGNEKIEEAIEALQANSTPELLAHTLTVIRRRIREGGQLVVAVAPNPGSTQMSLKTVQTPDGRGAVPTVPGLGPDPGPGGGNFVEKRPAVLPGEFIKKSGPS